MTNYSAFHWSEKSRKYAESSSSKSDESKQWAIGEPTEPEGGSAKYWAQQSAQGQIQSDWEQTDDTKKDFIKNKPAIINTTSSTSTTDILSANMGKELQDQITNLKARGRYLSVWNSTTGLAMTEPVSPLPYDYKAGDYFIVGTVGATNYKPNGSQYTGTASTTVETGTVNVNDTYYYDGSSWSLLSGGGQVTATFESLAGSPYDNSNLSSALNGKQPTLVSGTNIKTINGSTILGSGDISTSELPSQSGQSGKYLTTNGSTTSWATVDALPSQSGQSGKFLTTNGTSASWSEVEALPSQTGHSGSVLTTNGTNASWTGMSECAVVIESKRPTALDPTWYRLYSDGWVEQGGHYTHDNIDKYVTTNLLKEMSDTNYCLQITKEAGTAPDVSPYYSYISSYGNSSKTVSSFTTRMTTNNRLSGFDWEVKGYAAV